MKRARFLRNYEVQDGSGTSYKAGQEVEINDASFRHFQNRGAIEEVMREQAGRTVTVGSAGKLAGGNGDIAGHGAKPSGAVKADDAASGGVSRRRNK